MGFREVMGLGFRVQDLGSRVKGLGLRGSSRFCLFFCAGEALQDVGVQPRKA